jgi:regulator of PEP synthase PpsR (kinase-PPPase family)
MPTRQSSSSTTSRPWRIIYVLADSTGNLPRHMLRALLTQFPADAFEVRVKPFLHDAERLRDVMDVIEAEPGIVLHALVSRAAKAAIEAFCTSSGLPCYDLTGGLVDFLAAASGLQPSEDPRALHNVDEVYRRRIEAIEFAMAHDDGLGLDTLHQADVVLAGVSRTSKTPTTIYLAQQGLKAGNVALAMPVEPPRQLLALPPKKVVGLVIDPSQLFEIRHRRRQEWHMGDSGYNDPQAIEAEIQWSRRLFARQGWAIIDVTNQAIEETAARISQRLGLKPMGG